MMSTSATTKTRHFPIIEMGGRCGLKAGVNMNLSEILLSLKRDWKGKKGLWNTTRQLPDPTMAPQVVGQLFGVYLPIFNFKLSF